MIDSQSICVAETVPKTSEAGTTPKKFNVRKRYIAVDTSGRLLTILVTAASVQDRDAAQVLLWNLCQACRCINLTWTDAGYTGKLTIWAQATLHLGAVIVHRRKTHIFRFCLAAGSWSIPSPRSANTAAPSATTNDCPPSRNCFYK